MDGKHGVTRSMELELDAELQSKYGTTRHPEFFHWRRFAGSKRVQPSFCRISLIQRKSEYEITDDVESSSRGRDERHR